ncbi:MAG: TetR/AcrR family transcriptional regulator [Treponema sp.]|jgi:TetR/AcrR family transcriptional regulator|nr:TetR/AcrR family transcriptional regulator [Treponema sp.]
MDEDTKTLILNVGLDLFSRKGFESVGVQEIVDAAGVTKPTLYYHFKSKQGLLETIVAERGVELLAITRKNAEYRCNLVENLTALFKETLNFARKETRFYRLARTLFSSATETTEFIVGKPLRKELVAVLQALFRNAASDHGNMKGREYVYAETFLGLIETWAILSINGEISMGDSMQARIIHNFMHGIFS